MSHHDMPKDPQLDMLLAVAKDLYLQLERIQLSIKNVEFSIQNLPNNPQYTKNRHRHQRHTKDRRAPAYDVSLKRIAD
ncbi:MAG: hypothetical protein OEY86_14820 [Nitrospira sp.]|nr:hypothetical protein [Nitrospira sp.]